MQEYRDRMKEINVRPIKKVVEAKARKKRRAIKRLEKTKKKADMISENMGMSDYDKAQQIRQYVSIFFPHSTSTLLATEACFSLSNSLLNSLCAICIFFLWS